MMKEFFKLLRLSKENTLQELCLKNINLLLANSASKLKRGSLKQYKLQENKLPLAFMEKVIVD
jgi:hypothetical protein